LPVSGGLQDQPYGLFTKMNVAFNIYSTYREWLTKNEVDADWSEHNPDAFSIVVQIEKLLHPPKEK